MADETELEVFRQFTSHQEKFDYFLMSVAAAAIGFAIHRTTGMAMERLMLLLGVAVTLWAISFFAGCRRRQYVGSTMFANFELLRVQKGENPEIGMHPQKIQAASEGILRAAAYNSKRASFWATIQLYTLFIGAIVFIVWHVLEMSKICSK